MTKHAVAKKIPKNPKLVALVALSGDSDETTHAKAALSPSLNAALVTDAYQRNLMGDDLHLMELAGVLHGQVERVKGGDLSGLEAMLVGQATALQTIFVSLAKRAQVQTSQRNLEAFLGLAMKAQNQSRATIATLIDLKFPKQAATFMRQTNVSAGHQQINNHLEPAADSRTGQIESQQTKLTVEYDDGGTQMDTRATAATSGSHPTLQDMAALHGPDKRSRKG